MKIEVQLNHDTLLAINKLWQLPNQTTREGKSLLSILQFSAERFMKKSFSRIDKPKQKLFKMTLYHFEADEIEKFLRAAAVIILAEQHFEKTLVHKFCDNLNQQLA